MLPEIANRLTRLERKIRDGLTLAHLTVTGVATLLGNLVMATGNWIGLSAAAARIVFTDAAADTIGVVGADLLIDSTRYVGLGSSAGRFVFTDAATDSIAVTAADLNPALGVNVGTATGAGTGEIRASDKLRLGGQTTGGIKQQSSSVANNGTVTLFSATDAGILIVEGNKNVAIYTIKGSGNATQEVADPDGVYSITATTAGSTNIYWSGSQYTLENKRGGTLTYTITLIGSL